jgi:NAD+ synthase (glutamine-hydrolysing)
MPSIFSTPLSHNLSIELCQKLGVPLKTLPIKFLHSATKNLFESTYPEAFDGLTDENIQSRLRGTLLYTRSNQKGSMVINTSNKSELAVGYSTQYGDSVGAISLLGDLFKSEVFQLAGFVNRNFNNIIPEEIITREPSAELRDDQKDSDSLPPYPILDSLLEAILSNYYDVADLLKAGFEKDDVEKVFNLYKNSEYKRYQFAPIIKINAKSFGFGYRVPLSKNLIFYNK